MKKRIIVVGITIALFVGVIAAANSNFITNHVLGYSSKSLGRTIDTNNIRVNWGWPVTRVTADNLHIANMKTGTDPMMLSIDHAVIGVNLLSLLKGTLAFQEVSLDRPFLLLEKDDKGNANWNLSENVVGSTTVEALSPDDRTDVPVIERLNIKNGKISYKDPAKKTSVTLVAETIKGEASSKEDLHFKGDGTYQDRDFSLEVHGGNIFQLKDSSEPYPIDMTMNAGKTEATLKGTILDPFKLKGINIELSVKGKDASEMFTLIGMALPPTPPYNLTGQLDYQANKWNFKDFKGKLGDSDLSGSLVWDTERKRPLLTGEFVSNNLNFNDLGGFIGAPPRAAKVAAASDNQKIRAAKAQASPYIIPDTPLDISRLSAMDAQVTFTGKKLISDSLPLDDFFMKVELDDRVLKLNPLRFGTAQGDISSIMTINAQQEPVQISGDFTFSRLSLKPIFESLADKLGIKNVTDGYIGGAAQLKGTGKSLRQMLSTADGNIGLGMEGGQLSNLVVELLGLDVAQSLGFLIKGDQPVPIRCMIGDFAVKDGLMNVRHFVLDTTDSNIQGKGDINLKNEALDMTLYTNPKDTSILSLNSPIRLTGTLKKPNVNVNLEKIAGRGAVAAVSAVIFAPVAALAFIEPGLGKDSNCAKLVNTMEKHTDIQGEPGLIPKNKIKK